MKLKYKNRSGVEKIEEIKDPFRKYKGLDIQYLNRQYSKLTPNVSGRNISKDKWEEKLQVLFTELPGLKKLHEKVTSDLPYHMQKLSISMAELYLKYINHPSVSIVKRTATFTNRVVALCGTEVLNSYFYAMGQCMKHSKRYSINMFLKDVPLEAFFYIVFIKYYSVLYRQKWGLHLTINKLMPVPINKSVVEGTEIYEVNFDIIASKMAKICIMNFVDRKVNLDISKDTVECLMSLCNDLISVDEDIVKEKINLNTNDIPCVDIFIKLDKTNLFYTRDGGDV